MISYSFESTARWFTSHADHSAHSCPLHSDSHEHRNFVAHPWNFFPNRKLTTSFSLNRYNCTQKGMFEISAVFFLFIHYDAQPQHHCWPYGKIGELPRWAAARLARVPPLNLPRSWPWRGLNREPRLSTGPRASLTKVWVFFIFRGPTSRLWLRRVFGGCSTKKRFHFDPLLNSELLSEF